MRWTEDILKRLTGQTRPVTGVCVRFVAKRTIEIETIRARKVVKLGDGSRSPRIEQFGLKFTPFAPLPLSSAVPLRY